MKNSLFSAVFQKRALLVADQREQFLSFSYIRSMPVFLRLLVLCLVIMTMSNNSFGQSPAGCDIFATPPGAGNTSFASAQFGIKEGYIGDIVTVSLSSGMVTNACQATSVTGGVYTSEGPLVPFLDGVTLNPGFPVYCPTAQACIDAITLNKITCSGDICTDGPVVDPAFTCTTLASKSCCPSFSKCEPGPPYAPAPGPYNIEIKEEMVGVGITTPCGDETGIPGYVLMRLCCTGSVQTSVSTDFNCDRTNLVRIRRHNGGTPVLGGE